VSGGTGPAQRAPVDGPDELRPAPEDAPPAPEDAPPAVPAVLLRPPVPTAGPPRPRSGQLTPPPVGAPPVVPVPFREPSARRARSSQSFWTMVVGVPAVFSVLRLGVEAGGELQTTLLLVANVGPVNLVAALVTTAARLVSSGLVAIFAIGAVLSVSAVRQPMRRLPLFARWSHLTPVWFVVATFAVAAATWQILYLPLLLPAAAAAFQLSPRRLHERRAVRLAVVAALLVAYAWLVGPTLLDAVVGGEPVALVLLAVPPLLAPFVTGPLPAGLVRPLAVLAQTVVLAVLAAAAVPMIKVPVLPLTVTTVEAGPGRTEDVRGHVITVDEVSMVILQERGGVRYVPVGKVRAQVLCPTEGELPRHRLWVRTLHVEDSLLEGLGRQVRPVGQIDAACRAATDR
jgi:hypothetical protein